ncbi:MAG: SRPBCC family protein [Terracoccus sp.]
MPHFSVRIASRLSPEQAWSRVLDLHSHTAVIPLTTLTGDAMTASGLEPGSRFVARTGLGPVGFDDVMVVDEITAPTDEAPSRTLIHKEGRLVRGSIELRVSPTSTGSMVAWDQQISIAGLPGVLDPVVARVAKVAYGQTLRALLEREPEGAARAS